MTFRGPIVAAASALLLCISCGRAQGPDPAAGDHAPATGGHDSRTESTSHGTDARDSVLTVMLAGDVMLGTDWPDSSRLPARDGAGLLDGVAALLRRGDLACANLEGPLLDGGTTDKCADTARDCYTFRTPRAFAARLQEAGFGALSIANNHAMDFGVAGRASTTRILDSLGIRWSGPPGSHALLTVRGRRLAFVAFSTDDDANNLLRIDAARALVGELARAADIVVVSFHGGAEGRLADAVPDSMEVFLGERRGHLRAFAREMVDAGADLVFGHGPHVLRGMELYHDRIIAYSLGNFATARGISIAGASGIGCVLEIRVDTEGRFTGGRVHATVQRRHGAPVPDPQRRAIARLQTLSARDFPGSRPDIGADGTIRRTPAP